MNDNPQPNAAQNSQVEQTPLSKASSTPYPQRAVDKFFSIRGRLSRDEFLLKGFFPSAGIFILLWGVAPALWPKTPAPVVIAAYALCALWIIPYFCLLIKRLHDRGRSAAFLMILLPGIIPLYGIPFGLWFFVETACLKGKQEPNKFGLPAHLPSSRTP